MNRTLAKLYDSRTQPIPVEIRRSQMAAIVRFLSRAFLETQFEIETLKTLIIFCGAGLLLSLLLMLTRGLDLSAGFF
jgi:hypothetical protein